MFQYPLNLIVIKGDWQGLHRIVSSDCYHYKTESDRAKRAAEDGNTCSGKGRAIIALPL